MQKQRSLKTIASGCLRTSAKARRARTKPKALKFSAKAIRLLIAYAQCEHALSKIDYYCPSPNNTFDRVLVKHGYDLRKHRHPADFLEELRDKALAALKGGAR